MHGLERPGISRYVMALKIPGISWYMHVLENSWNFLNMHDLENSWNLTFQTCTNIGHILRGFSNNNALFADFLLLKYFGAFDQFL